LIDDEILHEVQNLVIDRPASEVAESVWPAVRDDEFCGGWGGDGYDGNCCQHPVAFDIEMLALAGILIDHCTDSGITDNMMQTFTISMLFKLALPLNYQVKLSACFQRGFGVRYRRQARILVTRRRLKSSAKQSN
jgi:hypothetical protein